jgi:hypothetical protein
MTKNANKYEWGEGIKGTGIGLLLLSAAGIGTGIPISVSGAVKKKRYIAPMNEIRRQANLSFNTSD